MSSNFVSLFWALPSPSEPSRKLSTAHQMHCCRYTNTSVRLLGGSGATTSTKPRGSGNMTCTVCGPWSTNGWHFIALTRIAPRRPSEIWSRKSTTCRHFSITRGPSPPTIVRNGCCAMGCHGANAASASGVQRATNRWVERILSFRETCRLKSKGTFPVFVNCVRSYYQNSQPDLSWI